MPSAPAQFVALRMASFARCVFFALPCLLLLQDAAFAAPEDGTWRELGPPLRMYPVLIVDAAHDRLVLFGGADPGGGVHEEVYVRSLAGPSNWQLLPVSGPGPGARRTASGIYDAAQGRMLVFGGVDDAGNSHADLWALDLGPVPHWTLLQPGGIGPSPRSSAGIAIDNVRTLWIVGASEQDAWSVNLDGPQTWTPHVLEGWDGAAPPGYPRAQTPTATGGWTYDPNARELITWNTARPFDCLWRACLGDTVRWKPLHVYPDMPGGPLSWNPVTGTLIVAGASGSTAWGDDGTVYYGIRFFSGSRVGERSNNGKQWGWVNEGEVAAWDPLRQRVVTYGGVWPEGWESSTWVLDPNSGWSRPYDPLWSPIAPRWIAPDLTRGRLLAFWSRHLWGFNNPSVHSLPLDGNGNWSLVADSSAIKPYAAPFPPNVVDPASDRIVSNGWYPTELKFNESQGWQPLAGAPGYPDPPTGPFILDPTRRLVWAIYGGVSRHELWTLDLVSGVWTKVSTGNLPFPYEAASWAAAYDAATDRMLLIGSRAEARLWAFPLATRDGWHPIASSPVGPYEADYLTLTVDSNRHRALVSTAGNSGFHLFDLPLDGSTTWQERLPRGARMDPGFLDSFYDPARDLLVLGPAIGSPAYFRAVQFESGATPVLADLDNATVDASGAHLRWRVGNVAMVYDVQRNVGGVFETIGSVRPNDSEVVAFDDAEAPAAGRVGYRLSWTDRGSVRTAGETWLDVPVASIGVSLSASINPSRGPVDLSWSVRPNGGPASILVFDVSGRLLHQSRIVGDAGSIRVDPGRAGIYFARLTQGNAERRIRFVMLP